MPSDGPKKPSLHFNLTSVRFSRRKIRKVSQTSLYHNEMIEQVSMYQRFNFSDFWERDYKELPHNFWIQFQIFGKWESHYDL